MTTEQSKLVTRQFFDRPGKEVIEDLADNWQIYNPDSKMRNKSLLEPGKARTLGIRTPFGTVLQFSIKEAELYTDEITKSRWPASRAMLIAQMEPGEIAAFGFRGTVLTFAKTQGAENIMFKTLEAMDRFGTPVRGDESTISSSKIARIAGLKHGDYGKLAPINQRGELGFLLTAGRESLSEEEIDRIMAEILAD